MSTRLVELLVLFAPLSLVAVGGGNAVLPELHRQAVLVHGWMDDTQFANAYALAQVVPGPNLLVVSLVGWSALGLPGALLAVIAMCGPSSALALLVARAMRSVRAARLRSRFQPALTPLTVGLTLASGLVLARSADQSPLAVGVTLATVAVLLRTSVHPLLLMSTGAALALAGLI